MKEMLIEQKNCITMNKIIISRKTFQSQKYKKLLAYVMYKWYKYSIAICNNNTEGVYMLQIHLEINKKLSKSTV